MKQKTTWNRKTTFDDAKPENNQSSGFNQNLKPIQ